MYKIKILPRVFKELKKIPESYEREIISVIKELKEYPDLGKSLKDELTGEYSIKVGVYRIIYIINEQNKLITVLTAGHRSTVYN